MKCQGEFKYRGITGKPGGEFVNNKGVKVSYDASYEIKVDEFTESGMFERRFKTPVDSPIVRQLSQIDLYQDVIIDFDVKIYGSNIKLIPTSVNLVDNNK